MRVSDNVKSAYMGTGKAKYITIEFPELNKTIKTGDKRIHSDSLYLSEGLVNSNSIEFVGCIASQFKINVSDFEEDIDKKKIVVKIHTDGTEEEPVPLFKGIVDEAPGESNTRKKEIIAYDELYEKGKTNVVAWYKALPFPVTLKYIRNSLLEFIGLPQVEIDLPNDDIEIKKQYNPSALKALPVLKAICQINGVFGIVNRNGNFDYRILGAIDDGLYPGFYPGKDALPGVSLNSLGLDSIDTTEFSFYKDVKFKNYIVKPVDKITIRQSEDDEGVTYGSGDNNYIIQGNMFTYGLSNDVLLQIVENIYPNIQGFSYRPFTSVNNGLPFLECGLDAVSYMMLNFKKTAEMGEMIYDKHDFYILNRELTGIQALKDSYSAKGEKYQTTFVSNLQEQIDLLKRKTASEVTQADLEDTKDEIIDYVDNAIVSGGGFDVESVKTAPAPAATNNYTIYLIEGEVMVI